MNKRLKTRWIEALRSGEYKQGRGYLKNTPAGLDETFYCCLGVLCEISPKVRKLNSIENGVLSPAAARYAGLSDTVGDNGTLQGFLADKNDKGQSFKKIATWIEKNL